MLDWLNHNSGAVNAALTLVLAIGTGIYVYLTARLVRESVLVRKSASQPLISVTTALHPFSTTILNLCIENVGGGPAYDVAFVVHQTVVSDTITDLSKIGFVKKGFRYFSPGQRVELFLASSIGNLERLREHPLTIGVSYRGAAHARIAETFVIDYTELENAPHISDRPDKEIATTLAKLEANIDAIVRGAAKVSVRTYTLEDEEREGRTHHLYVKLQRLPAEAWSEIEALVDQKLTGVT